MAATLSRFRGVPWLVLFGLLLAVSAGCIQETHDGDKTTFTNQWWAPLLIMILSLVAGPAGFLLRETSTRIALGLMICCPFGFLMGVSLFTDYCEVDPSGFKGQMGFFGSKTFEGRFDDISNISLEERQSRRSSSIYLVYRTKSGRQDEFSLGNQMTKAAAPLILGYAKDKGIPITE
jgi:hypothetical protein